MIVTLLEAAKLLRAAYKSHPDDYPEGWVIIKHTEKRTHTDVVAAINPEGQLHFLFPGTEGLFDMWRDTRRDLLRIGGDMALREGPAEAWFSVQKWCGDIAKQYQAKHIIVVGHSLGAAIGDIAAHYLSTLYDVTPIMFGAYKGANKAFYIDYVNRFKQYQRVQGRYDIVCGIMPWDRGPKPTLVTNNRHGIEKYIKSLESLKAKQNGK
jgi:hypothetical protein